MTPVFTRWRKAVASEGNGNNCVEVGSAPGLVGIRDTKDRDGGTLVMEPVVFAALVESIKRGRLR
ncbi:hypothetical protein FHR81_000962 [Actinoalloteichus hoggarensis]|uniref:Uncharacterized protein n=1 Tax=Actinoalloteichus hoggarensis TaxID=1470176 RepID=A0A221VYU1_9PSEU|nr:DUF397 domain-containing protein [Actinoalloteichus hoggarensis]ASO18699.1 hypothetical protein AHOG_05230 [Actinoalloteichus hoggarensis]MBB5919932.1 hypothetical protein [Actinoalloteichus hoggarensis]